MRPLGAILLLSLVGLGCNVVLGLDGLEADRHPGAAAGGGNGAGGDVSGGNASGGGPVGGSPPGGCASVCGTEGCGTCPTTPAVAIDDAGYSIDAMEVTTGQYKAWLETIPSTAGQVYPCEGNDSFEAGEMSADAVAAQSSAGFGSAPPPECVGFLASQVGPDLEKAVVCVDWCDAFAYCIWAGGHLCGEIGGGLLDISDENVLASNDPERSEWFRACSANGTQEFPYPGPFDASLCNDTNSGVDPADDHPACGANGVINMSGNVLEWENTCTTKNTPNALFDNCVRRGGAFFSGQEDLACALTTEPEGGTVTGTLPGTPSDNTGFRCCH